MQYQVFDIEDFKQLLKFWEDAQGIYYPVFYAFSENKDTEDACVFNVTYRLSTPACTVIFCTGVETFGEIKQHRLFGNAPDLHPFIHAETS